MTTDDRINRIKNMARRANARGDHLALQVALQWLEENWRNHRAAMAFYSELEIVS